jgi:hypothetical protein
MSQGTRCELLERFLWAGVVGSLEELQYMPETEFQATFNALIATDDGFRSDPGIHPGSQSLDVPPKLTIEQRIRTLKTQPGGFDIDGALDQGRGIAMDLLREYNEAIKRDISNPSITGLPDINRA